MTDRVAMQSGHRSSALLFATIELLEEQAQAGQPVSPSLCADICAGLHDFTEHVVFLESLVGAIDLLEDRDFRAAVSSLPVADRRVLARAAMMRSGRSTAVRFSQRRGR